jgi:16S rRNA (cytosine967-C5)-methyltransferase
VRLQKLKSSQAGLFFVQDLSSTIVSDIVSSAEPQVVYDLCAAPGGKSCSIALSLLSSKGHVIATDRTKDRVSLIRDAVHRLGLTNVTSSVRDALSEEGPSPDGADAVLLDAPCSGFGTVGRKVDVRWSKSEETIAELLALQHLLIRKAASLVKPGGWLVYSTCTIDREENEGIIGSFLQEAPDFSIHDLREQLPQTLCTSEGFYRTWPHRHAMAGAFAAALVRRS